MALAFRDEWLEAFYERSRHHRLIPASLENALFRKLQLLDAATQEADLKIPPGNRFERLQGKLSGWCSIRVNQQYRLIFQWADGVASDTWLDGHTYRV